MKKYYVVTVDPDDYWTGMYIKCNNIKKIDEYTLMIDDVEIKFEHDFIHEITEV